MKNFINKLSNLMPELSKSQKRIADYICNHYDKAAFMTAQKLGAAVGVSESTVVRFAFDLGYDGYPELQKYLQEFVRSKLTSVQRIEVSDELLSSKDILTSILTSDINKIRTTLEEISREDFEKAVESILNAHRIYILGVRSSSALAGFMGFYFNLIFDNVRLVHTNSVSEMFEQLIRVKEVDVVIGISFPRYSKRTVNAMAYAKKTGAKVIAITDSKDSPLCNNADITLTARSDMVSFADSLTAPLSLINALIVAISNRRREKVSNTLSELEHIWEEFQVYEKIDG